MRKSKAAAKASPKVVRTVIPKLQIENLAERIFYRSLPGLLCRWHRDEIHQQSPTLFPDQGNRHL